MTSTYALQIAVTAIVAMIIGSLWYSPILFGKQWIKLMGWTDTDIQTAKNKGGMWKTYLGQFIVSAISFIVLSFFIQQTDAYGWMDGALLGFFAWLGFVMPKDAASLMWEGRSMKLTLITTGASLVTFIVAGAILTSWMQ